MTTTILKSYKALLADPVEVKRRFLMGIYAAVKEEFDLNDVELIQLTKVAKPNFNFQKDTDAVLTTLAFDAEVTVWSKLSDIPTKVIPFTQTFARQYFGLPPVEISLDKIPNFRKTLTTKFKAFDLSKELVRISDKAFAPLLIHKLDEQLSFTTHYTLNEANATLNDNPNVLFVKAHAPIDKDTKKKDTSIYLDMTYATSYATHYYESVITNTLYLQRYLTHPAISSYLIRKNRLKLQERTQRNFFNLHYGYKKHPLHTHADLCSSCKNYLSTAMYADNQVVCATCKTPIEKLKISHEPYTVDIVLTPQNAPIRALYDKHYHTHYTYNASESIFFLYTSAFHIREDGTVEEFYRLNDKEDLTSALYENVPIYLLPLLAYALPKFVEPVAKEMPVYMFDRPLKQFMEEHSLTFC